MNLPIEEAARLLGQYALVRRAGYPTAQLEAFLDAAYAAFDPDPPDVAEWDIIGELRGRRGHAPLDPLELRPPGRTLAMRRAYGSVIVVREAVLPALQKAVWTNAPLP